MFVKKYYLCGQLTQTVLTELEFSKTIYSQWAEYLKQTGRVETLISYGPERVDVYYSPSPLMVQEAGFTLIKEENYE